MDAISTTAAPNSGVFRCSNSSSRSNHVLTVDPDRAQSRIGTERQLSYSNLPGVCPPDGAKRASAPCRSIRSSRSLAGVTGAAPCRCARGPRSTSTRLSASQIAALSMFSADMATTRGCCAGRCPRGAPRPGRRARVGHDERALIDGMFANRSARDRVPSSRISVERRQIPPAKHGQREADNGHHARDLLGADADPHHSSLPSAGSGAAAAPSFSSFMRLSLLCSVFRLMPSISAARVLLPLVCTQRDVDQPPLGLVHRRPRRQRRAIASPRRWPPAVRTGRAGPPAR